MIKKPILFFLLAGITITSCKSETKEESKKETVEINENLASTHLENDNGQRIDMSFDKVKGTAEVIFNGDKIYLTSQPTASGILYTNTNYELRGKGQEVIFKKDGQIIFTNAAEIKKNEFVNAEGEKLYLDVNITKNTAVAYWKKDTINLVGKVTASGNWFANENYDIRGKGDEIELTKEGVILFKSK